MIDIDWNAPKSGCTTPGCPHPSFHVCYFGREAQLLQETPIPGKSNKSHPSPYKGKNLGPRSDIARMNMSMVQQERQEMIRFHNRHRDAKIVAKYAQGDVSIRDLQEEFGLSRNGVRAILKRAEAKGEIKVRPRGTNLRFGKVATTNAEG